MGSNVTTPKDKGQTSRNCDGATNSNCCLLKFGKSLWLMSRRQAKCGQESVRTNQGLQGKMGQVCLFPASGSTIALEMHVYLARLELRSGENWRVCRPGGYSTPTKGMSRSQTHRWLSQALEPATSARNIQRAALHSLLPSSFSIKCLGTNQQSSKPAHIDEKLGCLALPIFQASCE